MQHVHAGNGATYDMSLQPPSYDLDLG